MTKTIALGSMLLLCLLPTALAGTPLGGGTDAFCGEALACPASLSFACDVGAAEGAGAACKTRGEGAGAASACVLVADGASPAVVHGCATTATTGALSALPVGCVDAAPCPDPCAVDPAACQPAELTICKRDGNSLVCVDVDCSFQKTFPWIRCSISDPYVATIS